MKNFGNGNFSFDMINMRTYHKVMGHSNSGVRLGSNPMTKNKFIYLPFIIFEIEIIMIPASSFAVVTNSVAQLCPTLCHPMDCSIPSLPVHHPTQTHVHQVDDTIQPSCPLLSPSSPTFNFSKHQDLFR